MFKLINDDGVEQSKLLSTEHKVNCLKMYLQKVIEIKENLDKNGTTSLVLSKFE